ncbi:MAG: hypothetical protein NTW59_03435 [Candidatus Diapherotrites archaeon]|nr:hypothetical protein [Candidatus Diapherotrites archaeon]
MPRPEQGKVVKVSEVFYRLQEDIRSLNSSVLIITQKMRYIVRNEKILGRNLIVLHRKLKDFESQAALGQTSGGAGGVPGSISLDIVMQKLEELNKRAVELQVQLQDLQQNAATKDELQEMRYVINTINPLQFATLEQVKEMLGRKAGSTGGVKPERKKKKY